MSKVKVEKGLVDVVICAHDEAEHLPRLFESLARQSVGPGAMRIILVDNASEDDTAAVATRLAKELGLDATCVHEPELSYNAAMNAGYRHATAEYVAHTDAHTWVDPHWIERAATVIDELRPDLLGGPYRAFSLGDSPAWFRYNRMSHGDERRSLGPREFLCGTNMIWRRSVVAELGGFGPETGLVGRGFVRGDEIRLMVRLRRQRPDAVVIYDPELIVHHLTFERMYSLRYGLRCAYGDGMHSAHVHGAPPRLGTPRLIAELLARAGFTAATGVASPLFRDRARYPHWRNYWFERLFPQVERMGAIVSQLRAAPTDPGPVQS